MTPEVRPTLTAVDAPRRAWDAVVVGAGPAGSVAAYRLAGAGLSVLLVERSVFPRDKVCGCCLSAAALAALESAGLSSVAESLGGVSLSTVRLHSGRRAVDLPLPPGFAVSRSRFDAALVRAAIRAGAEFLPATRAKLDQADRSSVRVRLNAAHEEHAVHCRVLVTADGLAGRSAEAVPGMRWHVAPGARFGCGVLLDRAPPAYAPGTVYMACGPGGYVGVVRVEGGRLNMAASLDVAHVRQSGGPGPAAAAILGSCGLTSVGADARWTGTPALTRSRSVLQRGRVFAIGDAAGYVEPFTGEGIAWALASANAVVPFVSRVAAAPRVAPDADEWSGEHRRCFKSGRRRCLVLARALRHPWIVGAALAALERWPWLARPLVGAINGRARPSAAPEPAP